MYCSACGKKCPDGAKFCAWCGEKLPEIEPAAAAPEELRFDAESAAPILEAEAAGSEPAEAVAPAPVKPAAAQPEPEEGEDEEKDAEEDEDDGQEPDVSERAQGPAANPMHRMFQRPAQPRAEDGRTVRPLSANPAQPLRGEQAALSELASEPPEEPPAKRAEHRPKAAEQVDDDEWVRPARPRGDQESARRARPARDEWDDRDDRELRTRPEREGAHAVRSARDARSGKARDGRQEPRPARTARDGWEDRNAKSPRERITDRLLPGKSTHGKAVTASGGMVTPPSRRPPARSASPFRPAKRSKDDLFFEDLEMPKENFYDEAAEERALARRIKSIVALAILVGAAIVAIWLMWMPGGQIFRARWNLGAPATAYKAMGDQDRASGQLQRAAAAYHNALKLDPENYAYALLVGQTYDMIGDRENAIKAFMVCIQLKPAEAQPYKQLVDIYTVMGDSASAESWRAEGYKQTGDASLAPAG